MERDLTLAIMSLWWEHDLDHDDLLWHPSGGRLQFAVQCSDFFAFACADAEPIETLRDVELLAECVTLCKGSEDWAPRLYAAYRRKRKPMSVAYQRVIPDALHELFNQASNR